MTANAEVAIRCPDEDIPLIRELMSYDALCPTSTTFTRDGMGQLQLVVPASPLHWSRQVEWPWILRKGDFKNTDFVLDVGSGWSCLKFALAKRCYKVTCLEKEEEYIRKAQPAIDCIIGPCPIKMCLIQQHQGDVRDMFYYSGVFDKVVACSVIEHMPDGHLEAVKEMVRVLKPGGKLLLTMDVRLKCEEDFGDFYLGLNEASQIFAYLGCAPIPVPSPMLGSRQMNGKVEIIVVMIDFTKE